MTFRIVSASLLPVLRAVALDSPAVAPLFRAKMVIPTSSSFANSTYATDLGGDAKVPSASFLDDKIAPYEGLMGPPACHWNRTPDPQAITSSASPDCDPTGVRREYENSSGAPLDCNEDGVLEPGENSKGAADWKADGVPDTGEVAAVATLDLNTNGPLDTCEMLGPTCHVSAVANSTGLPGTGSVLGSDTVFSNDSKGSARPLPANAPGHFVAPTTSGSVFPVTHSVGTLDVIGRVAAASGAGP